MLGLEVRGYTLEARRKLGKKQEKFNILTIITYLERKADKTGLLFSYITWINNKTKEK